MKRFYSIVLAVILMLQFCSIAFAVLPSLQHDGGWQKLQDSIAPDPTKDFVLTVNSQNVDMSNNLRWRVYTPTACVYRVMSSATVVGNKHTLLAGAFTQFNVNHATASVQVRYSGCANGEGQAE